ncbi:hypothetical protein [Deinococcus altitudinis]|uniref:hypothetical protein n=1 Tax=Deinococcus altitudinis TaxID=468914 RepID=UPI003892299E
MTTTAMKRAGQLVAHLETLHQISDVRQLLLLQLAMRERQDQVALFRRQEGSVTLSMIGVQPAAPTEELSHRAGNAPAAALLNQLQQISGIRGDDVAFSGGQIAEIITAQTQKIEASEGLAKLDAALLALAGKLESQSEAAPAPAVQETAPVSDDAASDSSAVNAEAARELEEPVYPDESATDDSEAAEPDEDRSAELSTGLTPGRSSRRRSA